MPAKLKQLSLDIENRNDLAQRFRSQVETEQKANKELWDKNFKQQAEINRLEMILSYYDERISFLV